jgi:protein phosphatase
MVEQGLLDEREADRHPLAHVVTRAVGVDDALTLDYRSGQVEPGDYFILCSDGVSNELGNDEIRDFLNGGPIHNVSQAMMHSLLINECDDNITCVIVRMPDL